MNTVSLPGGGCLPVLGLGTWRMGESARARKLEVAAVRNAFELGYRLVDTAEMYGEGGAEEIVGQALTEAMRAGTVARDDVFIVSKVYPHNASRQGTLAACERSRRRLGIDMIDLYLLHWPGPHPLQDTVASFEALTAQGRIGHWGVSNFDTADMEALWQLEGGPRCATNQVYYSLTERGPAFDLLPWMRARALPLMAYSPIDQGQLAADATLRTLAAARAISPAQLALAWLIAQSGIVAIPKALRDSHLRENLAAADLALSAIENAELDRRFPRLTAKSPLAMR
jgi:diketogulonate reductase-like aldo/keto reductase